jgi:hypothetical protein
MMTILNGIPDQAAEPGPEPDETTTITPEAGAFGAMFTDWELSGPRWAIVRFERVSYQGDPCRGPVLGLTLRLRTGQSAGWECSGPGTPRHVVGLPATASEIAGWRDEVRAAAGQRIGQIAAAGRWYSIALSPNELKEVVLGGLNLAEAAEYLGKWPVEIEAAARTAGVLHALA